MVSILPSGTTTVWLACRQLRPTTTTPRCAPLRILAGFGGLRGTTVHPDVFDAALSLHDASYAIAHDKRRPNY